jgi:hypothetical protein
MPRRSIHGGDGTVVRSSFREDRALRLVNRVTIAKRRLTEIPHINTPMMLSSGPSVRQFDGRLKSLQPSVE